MNILRVIASMDPSSGGPCQGIRNSVPALEKLGVRNEVVCLDDPDSSFLGKDPFPVHALGVAKSPWAYHPGLIPWLLKNFPRFEVIIVHGLWLYHGHAARKALLQYKEEVRRKGSGGVPRLFVMPHGMMDPYFQKAPGRKLKALRNWAYWKLIEEKIVNGADGILFTCEEELRLARQPFRPYQPKKELNVGYGIAEPPTYIPAMAKAFEEKCPSLKGQPYLLFLSRIHEKKGVDLLINAYAQIGANELDTGKLLPKLVIAGPGLDTAYGQKLQQSVEESEQLKNLVYFPGMLTGNAKWGAFYGSQAFVLPSHQENFGIAVVEALASGKPVLISDQVNIWREIKEAGGGLVEKDTLIGSLKLLGSWVTLTEEEQLKMSKQSRYCYEKKFSIAPNALRFKNAIDLYNV